MYDNWAGDDDNNDDLLDDKLHCRECDCDFDESEVPWVLTWHYGSKIEVPGDCPNCGEDADWGNNGGSAAEDARAERRQMGICD